MCKVGFIFFLTNRIFFCCHNYPFFLEILGLIKGLFKEITVLKQIEH